MALNERIGPLCDLLLGAAYADDEFKHREREEVLGLLEDMGGADADIKARITAFNPVRFDVAAAAAAFKDDPEDDRRRVLFLIAAINDADDEVDFAEDDYLRAVAKALGLPDTALAGLTVDVELDEVKEAFAAVKKGPPKPPPPKKEK